MFNSKAVSQPWEVTAIILSYNLPDQLIFCVESLLQQPEIKELILIENHSKVDMVVAYDRIAELCKQAQIFLCFHKPENALSFSEGQNWGIDNARYDLILLMNNDAYFVQPNSLHTSIRLLSDKVRIVGHKILDPDGRVNHFGCYVSPLLFHAGHCCRDVHPDEDIVQYPQFFPAVTAAVMLFHRSNIRFDAHYWFEYEDVDFCLQHLHLGFEVVCNPACVAVHPESTSRGNIQKTNNMWIERQTRGRVYFRKRWRWLLIRHRIRFLRNWKLYPDAYKAHLKQVLGDVVGVLVSLWVVFFVLRDILWLYPLFVVLCSFFVAKKLFLVFLRRV